MYVEKFGRPAVEVYVILSFTYIFLISTKFLISKKFLILKSNEQTMIATKNLSFSMILVKLIENLLFFNEYQRKSMIPQRKSLILIRSPSCCLQQSRDASTSQTASDKEAAASAQLQQLSQLPASQPASQLAPESTAREFSKKKEKIQWDIYKPWFCYGHLSTKTMKHM